MSDWTALVRELDAWAEAGRTASLWWRNGRPLISLGVRVGNDS